MHLSNHAKADALFVLEQIIEAAENSNASGERHLMAAAHGMRLLSALKGLLPELRRMKLEKVISNEQWDAVEQAIKAAEGNNVTDIGGHRGENRDQHRSPFEA